MESILKTKADATGDFLRGLAGSVHVTFEEGTEAAWLYDGVKPLVAEVIVCDPGENEWLAVGNKGDPGDTHQLAQLLRGEQLKLVYHGDRSLRWLKELAHNYDALMEDSIRVMNRLKALFRGRAIGCAGPGVYDPRQRKEWLGKLRETRAQRQAEFLYEELDHLKGLPRRAKRAWWRNWWLGLVMLGLSTIIAMGRRKAPGVRNSNSPEASGPES